MKLRRLPKLPKPCCLLEAVLEVEDEVEGAGQDAVALAEDEVHTVLPHLHLRMDRNLKHRKLHKHHRKWCKVAHHNKLVHPNLQRLRQLPLSQQQLPRNLRRLLQIKFSLLRLLHQQLLHQQQQDHHRVQGCLGQEVRDLEGQWVHNKVCLHGKALPPQEDLYQLDYLLQEDLGLVRPWVLVGPSNVCQVQVHQEVLE